LIDKEEELEEMEKWLKQNTVSTLYSTVKPDAGLTL
jgi:hypothetical protein